MISNRQVLSIVVLSLLLYNSEQFQIPIEVLVLYSGTQIPLISLLQKVENISTSSLESIKDNVAVVRGANITIKVFDLDSWGRDRETSSAVSVLIQNVFTKDQCLKNFTIVGPSNSDSAYAVARLIKRSGVSVRHVHTALLPGPLAAEVRGTSQGLLPPADLLADASAALVKHANWSTLTAVYDHTSVDMNLIFQRFQDLLHGENIKLHSVFPWIPNLKNTLNSNLVRIFFLFLSPCYAMETLCKASALGITSPNFQWVVVKTTRHEILSCHASSCNEAVVMRALKKTIFVNFEPHIHRNVSTITQQAYEKIIWNIVNNFVNSSEAPHRSNNFSKDIYIKQIQASDKAVSMVYSLLNNSFINEEPLFLVPNDPIISLKVMNFPLGIFFIVLNVYFFLMYLVLLVLTVVKRNHHAVRTSSPPLLYLSYIGMFLFNLTFSIYFVQKTIPITSDTVYINLCWIYQFANNTGATLVLGTLAVKLWRLYRIFVHFTNPGHLLSNRMLVLLVCSLPSLDFIICSLWLILDPIFRLYSKVSCNNLQATCTYLATCRSKASPFLLPLLTGYKILILMVILVLIYKLRKKIPKAHNRLKSATLTVGWYLTLIILFVWTPTYVVIHFLLMDIMVEAILLAFVFFTLQGIFTALMLIPPLRTILKTSHDTNTRYLIFCNNCL